MSATSERQQDESFEESRDRRRKFLNKARQELSISQDELQQKRLSLHTSFEVKSNNHRDSLNQTEAIFRKLKPPKSPWQGTSEKIAYKLREINSGGIKSQFKENPIEIQNRILQENEKLNYDSPENANCPINLENTLELSRIGNIMAFGGTSKMSSQNVTPLKEIVRISPSKKVRDEIITQKEHQMILDKELMSLETRMIEFFQREKKNILKENMSQMKKMESKWKEKYNSVVKDMLESKSREDEHTYSQADLLMTEEQQIRHATLHTPEKNLLRLPEKKKISSRSRQDGNNREKRDNKMLVNYPEDLAEVMKEVKLNLSQDPEDDEYYNINEKTAQILEENINLEDGKEYTINIKSPEDEAVQNQTTEKIKALELENETLRKRVTLLEWLLKSEAEKTPAAETFERLDYNKFISPKVKDYVSRMSSPSKQPDQEKQETKSLEPKVLDVGSMSQSDRDNQITELQQQIRVLNKTIKELEETNKNLTDKIIVKGWADEIENKSSSEENASAQLNAAVEFWKTKCGSLAHQYFNVIKKLKADNENMKEELLLETKEFKKTTLRELRQIQQAYQEKVQKLGMQLQRIEAQSKDPAARNGRGSSAKTKMLCSTSEKF